MKQIFALLVLTMFLVSCNQTPNITGNWAVTAWEGQAYSIFNLTDSSSKTRFDEFAYTFFTKPKTKLIFTKDFNFNFGTDSSKIFYGTYNYVADSILILYLENKSIRFSILHETKDSLLLYIPNSEQIQAKNVKLLLLR